VSRNSSGEQELVILITPHLVSPISEFEKPPLPGNDVFEPTDLEFYFANRLESRRSRDFRTSVQTDYARQRNAQKYQFQNLMIGNVGPTDRVILKSTAVETSSNSTKPKPDSNSVAKASSRKIGG